MPDLPTQLGTTLRFISSSNSPIVLPGASVETTLLLTLSFNSVSFLFLHHEPIQGPQRNLFYDSLHLRGAQETQLAILTGFLNTDGLLNMDLGRG